MSPIAKVFLSPLEYHWLVDEHPLITQYQTPHPSLISADRKLMFQLWPHGLIYEQNHNPIQNRLAIGAGGRWPSLQPF